jgi:hypothetical protein
VGVGTRGGTGETRKKLGQKERLLRQDKEEQIEERNSDMKQHEQKNTTKQTKRQ